MRTKRVLEKRKGRLSRRLQLWYVSNLFSCCEEKCLPLPAFDDQTSTFIIPGGSGFQVIFCPGGRSTNILSAESGNVTSASHGEVSFGGGGDGNNSDNKATRDCHDLPVEAARFTRGHQQAAGIYKRGPHGDLEGFHVLELVRQGLHKRNWMHERNLQRYMTSAAFVVAEMGGLTWWLMVFGLLVTAGVFVML
jgi:hypothetical protein